ncbi:glycosyltransferase family 2 protein [Mobilicoccus pelagius]|nr:glycosyltransferase family 2 protein [Mobilicoccus pelagius]
MSDRSPRLSLAMIVRDEERCVARALDSARPLVDEMVVLDTGSVDATPRLAREHGARVESFEWPEDFSVARNATIERCTGDLVLILDADEWIEADDADTLRRWTAAATPGTAGLVTVASETESEGRQVTSHTESVRLLPRSCRYVGRVHEQPQGYAQTEPVPGVVLRHDGYLPEQSRRKQGRNERLLLRSLNDDPGNPYLLFQVGRERQIAGDFAGACAAYEQALPGITDSTPWRDELRARLLFSLEREGRHADALRSAQEILRSPDVSAEVLLAAGNLFVDLAGVHPQKHAAFLQMARRAWLTCLEVGDPTDGRDHTPGCGGHLAATNLAALSTGLGDEEGARFWTKRADELRR